MTRTSVKTGGLIFSDSYEELHGIADDRYAGYRKFTIVNNLVVNYTYDYNNDGIRDPQLCTPNGRYNISTTFDLGIGTSSTANVTWNLINNMELENHGEIATGQIWSFTTGHNNPPNYPYDPFPENGAIDIDINANLSWSCSDPDGDDLTYDVYF